MVASQDWAGLRALWRGVVRVAGILLMAVTGAIAMGFAAFLTTIFVYGLGAMIGLPAGAALGAWWGAKAPVRDSVIVFVLSCAAWVTVQPYARGGEPSEFLRQFAGVGSFAFVAAVLTPNVRRLPFRVRYWIALPLAVGCVIVAAVAILSTIYA